MFSVINFMCFWHFHLPDAAIAVYRHDARTARFKRPEKLLERKKKQNSKYMSIEWQMCLFVWHREHKKLDFS